MSSPIFGQLETALADYLTDITHRAQHGDEATAAALARFDLPRVVQALRAVLDEHEPDEHGRCPTCRTRRFGRAPAPCRAYLTAHLCLVVTEDDTATEAPEQRPAPARTVVPLSATPRHSREAPSTP